MEMGTASAAQTERTQLRFPLVYQSLRQAPAAHHVGPRRQGRKTRSVAAKYRKDLEEIRESLKAIVQRQASLLAPASMQLKIIMAMCRRTLETPLQTLFSSSKQHTRTAECFESAVTDLVGFFSLHPSALETEANIQEVQE